MVVLIVNVYIDGFNLYYGCLKGTPYRWLDMSALCTRLLDVTDQLNHIHYYTARITRFPNNPHKADRQNTYIRAIQTIPNLSVHFGKYLTHEVNMRLVHPMSNGDQYALVYKTEEKGSDVNLATHLLHDAHLGKYDLAVVISNDSDLYEPIRVVKEEMGLPVGIVNPHNKPAKKLLQVAYFYKQLRAGLLAKCQFPPTLQDSKGRTITKPEKW